MCPRVIFGHFLSQGTRYAITTEASFHGAFTFLRVFRGVFRSFSRGLNHPETCAAGAFIRSALVLFALLPLLEPGASLTSTEGTSKTVSSVSERSQPSCLTPSHSSRQVGFPFIIQTYVVVCVCVVIVVVCCCFSHSAHWLPTRKKLLYTVANPARGLLNREKKEKKKSGSALPPPSPRALLVRRKNKNNKIKN